MKISGYFICFLVVFSCIERYDFVIVDDTSTLVVEGFISDKSFQETLSYPSDGRYFTIKLSRTSDVTNVHSPPVVNATVKLVSDSGSEWSYSESATTPGLFQLLDENFKAQSGIRYQLQIAAGEEQYESDWEFLPEVEVPSIGEMSFTEGTKQLYVVEASEFVLRTVKVITSTIGVGANTTGKPIYYRWKFDPMWIYRAPLSPSSTSPGHVCWITDVNYLNTYALQIDNAGGYRKDLFTIPTVRNSRIFEDFSVLVVQHVLSQDEFYFYQEMMEQNGGSALIDKPPFNLQSNIHSVNGDKSVSGYFGVVKEQAVRWYFNKSHLSYKVSNTLKADCSVYYGPPLPGCPIPQPAFAACECKYCLDYSFGTPTDVMPSWWRQ